MLNNEAIDIGGGGDDWIEELFGNLLSDEAIFLCVHGPQSHVQTSEELRIRALRAPV